MTRRLTIQDRRALVIADRVDLLAPDEAADVALLVELLADSSTWAEPCAGLEDAVVEAVVQAQSTVSSLPTRSHRPRRWRIALSAAVVAILAGVAVATRDRTSPDFRAELTATELVPPAGGSVDIAHYEGGFRITLRAHGLSALPPGEFYEAWLKTSDGTMVPIGTFSSSAEAITLWSGVSPTDFPIISVTIEVADNSQASSGHVVLSGSVNPVG